MKAFATFIGCVSIIGIFTGICLASDSGTTNSNRIPRRIENKIMEIGLNGYNENKACLLCLKRFSLQTTENNIINQEEIIKWNRNLKEKYKNCPECFKVIETKLNKSKPTKLKRKQNQGSVFTKNINNEINLDEVCQPECKICNEDHKCSKCDLRYYNKDGICYKINLFVMRPLLILFIAILATSVLTSLICFCLGIGCFRENENDYFMPSEEIYVETQSGIVSISSQKEI